MKTEDKNWGTFNRFLRKTNQKGKYEIKDRSITFLNTSGQIQPLVMILEIDLSDFY